MKLLKWAYQFLGSLKFAVVVIIALAVISTVGTLVETKYNAEIAQALVYKSIYMYITMISLVVSVILSALHRIPWKRRHTPFLVAHLGIIILVFGSWITLEFGIDGSMVLTSGKSNRYISLPQKEFKIYSSFDGTKFTTLLSKEVDFFQEPPNINFSLPDGDLKVNGYKPFALKDTKIINTEDERNGPAVRFILQNENINLAEWLLHNGRRNAELMLGPAKVVLTIEDYPESSEENVIVLKSEGQTLSYMVLSKNHNTLRGTIKESEKITTPWMGMEMQLVNYYPHAKEEVDFIARDYPNNLTTAAVRLQHKDETYWVQENSLFRLFTDTAAYYIVYGNKQIDVGIKVDLLDFRLGRYPGTMRAASYESLVKVDGKEEHLISMNEPLKYKGFTLYQSSFQEDAAGRPIASILSVNYDPGRWTKYFGSFLIVLGSILLFYMRKYYYSPKRKSK